MSFVAIKTDNAPQAVGAYSQAVSIGKTYYFSGMLGIDPKTSNISPVFADQLRQILNNIDALLCETKLTRKNIVKTTIFMKDLADFAQVNQAYTEFFTTPFPARSCVEVSRLPKDALIEIEVIAVAD